MTTSEEIWINDECYLTNLQCFAFLGIWNLNFEELNSTPIEAVIISSSAMNMNVAITEIPQPSTRISRAATLKESIRHGSVQKKLIEKPHIHIADQERPKVTGSKFFAGCKTSKVLERLSEVFSTSWI